jgi:hypothetical protein
MECECSVKQQTKQQTLKEIHKWNNMKLERQYEGLWMLTRIVDNGDPLWDDVVTVCDSLSGLRKKFDIADAIRNGWKLLSPSEARKHMEKSIRDETAYQEALKA